MAEDSCKLFVAGLPDSINEDALRKLFEETGGQVADVTLPRDRATGNPRGFGFVTMNSADEANQARETLHGTFHGGRSISVRPFASDAPKRDAVGGPPSAPGGFRAREDADKERKLYIGNLPYDASPAEIEASIAAAGGEPVQRVILPADAEGKNRGYGFLQFATPEAAKAALDVLQGAQLRGRLLRVLPAQERGERPAGPPSGRRDDFAGGFNPTGPSGAGFPPRESAPAPPRAFGPPAKPARKGFDERRKRSHEDGGGAVGGGGGRKRGKNDWNPNGGWEDD